MSKTHVTAADEPAETVVDIAPGYRPGELHRWHPLVQHAIAKARRERALALYALARRLFGRASGGARPAHGPVTTACADRAIR